MGCGAEVLVTSDGSGGGGAEVPPAGGSGGGSSTGCGGEADFCADECGSDYYPHEQECVDGRWQCLEGTVNPDDCPPGTCWGGPLSCEICEPSGWECEPTIDCVGGCDGLVCAVCPDDADAMLLGACWCECDDAGMFSCELHAGCCNDDLDCGDETYAPCVENVCKVPVLDACWKDSECATGYVCEGAVVCPCGYDCDAPDEPGTCVPG